MKHYFQMLTVNMLEMQMLNYSRIRLTIISNNLVLMEMVEKLDMLNLIFILMLNWLVVLRVLEIILEETLKLEGKLINLVIVLLLLVTIHLVGRITTRCSLRKWVMGMMEERFSRVLSRDRKVYSESIVLTAWSELCLPLFSHLLSDHSIQSFPDTS